MQFDSQVLVWLFTQGQCTLEVCVDDVVHSATNPDNVLTPPADGPFTPDDDVDPRDLWITCPPDQTLILPEGVTKTKIFFSSATGGGNCCDDCVVLAEGKPSGSKLKIGVHENVWRVFDEAGNTMECTQVISIFSNA